MSRPHTFPEKAVGIGNRLEEYDFEWAAMRRRSGHFLEVDLVSHDDSHPVGDSVQILSATDVITRWTESGTAHQCARLAYG